MPWVLGAVLVAGPMASHGEEDESAGESFQDGAEEFLSDPGRVGAIAGSIAAAAAFAHPFAPLVGNVAGFFVGKASDFSDDEEDDGRAGSQQRSIVPAGGELALPSQSLALSLGDGATSEDVDGDIENASAPESIQTEGEPLEENENATLAKKNVPDRELEIGEDVSTEAVGPDKEFAAANAKSALQPTPNLIISKDVGGRQAELDRLAAQIRAEQNRSAFEVNQQCMNQQASRIRKKLVVAGFNLQHPGQAVFGGLGTVSQAVNDALYQNLLQTGEVLPFAAPGRQMFASLESGASRAGWGNRIDKYSAVSRQMGAQFVVSGIIRSVDVNRSDAWDSSYASSIKRSLFSADTVRQFVVDVVLHDGYTGQVVSENRYTAAGRWDIPRTGKVSFGSPEFEQTGYGEAVSGVMNEISSDVMASIDCQAMLVPILEVSGKDLLLDVGTRSGLLPGDKLRVVRAESSLQRPDAPPKLWDTGVDLHIHQLSLDTSRAWMPSEGGQINIREGDYAIIY